MVDKVQMILQRFKMPKSGINRLYREGFLDNVEVGAVTARDAYGGSPGPGPSGRQFGKRKTPGLLCQCTLLREVLAW